MEPSSTAHCETKPTDFYTELHALYIPYTSVVAPQYSQKPVSRIKDAEGAVNNLISVFSREMDEVAEDRLLADFGSEPRGECHIDIRFNLLDGKWRSLPL